MFEKTLTEKLQRIFDLKKVTFDHPSESQEQEGIFVAVESAKCKVIDARQIARVTGTLHIFASADKLPFGYFSKKIAAADPADTKDLFFYNFEEHAGTFLNIAERKLGFVYLYDSQFDPAIGDLSSINLSYPES